MNSTKRFERAIRVDVRDADGRLLEDTTISFTEDDKDRGKVLHTDGHSTLNPQRENSIIGVTVEHGGVSQSRKLALEQTQCSFVFANVRRQPDGNQGSSFRSPTVIAAVITGLVALAVGYWQFVYKSESTVQLAVYVKDAATMRPIARAEVTLERASRHEPRTADDQGTARFKIVKGIDKDLRVTARAIGYNDSTLSIDAPITDDNVELKLTGKTRSPAPPTTGGKTVALEVPNGTWQVMMVGDPALQRVSSGTFAFSPQPAGAIIVTGRFLLDGIETRLEGTAGKQNAQVFIKFNAKAGAGQWAGQGNLEIVGPNRMKGHLTDQTGKEVPVVLKKA